MTPPPRASAWDWFAWCAGWGCSNLLIPRLSPSQHIKSCKKCQIKCWKWNPTFCQRVALRASPPGGGRNGTKISLKKYEHISEESWRSILQNIDFWNFGCAGEKQTAVSEAWSGQRPQCSWNLGIAPGLGRNLEVWGFGRWWGVRSWFKTQPSLALLSSQKKATMEMQVYSVLCWTSGKMFFVSFRGRKTKGALSPDELPRLRLADWGWALSHKKNEKKTDILRNPGWFSWSFHFMVCNTLNWTRHKHIYNLKAMPQASYKMVLGRLLLWFWLLNVTRQFLLWPCKSYF